MHIVYTGEEAPTVVTKSIFLAGPSPRNDTDPNWRPKAFKMLEDLGYNGVVYAPIYKDQNKHDNGAAFDYEDQIAWESRCLNQTDCIVFWVPRDIKGGVPAFTTNVEFGFWATSGKVVFGAPPKADKNEYLKSLADREGIPVFDTLKATLAEAVKRLGEGAARTGGERDIPLHLWKKPEFQTWLAAQKAAGNILNGATVSWSFRVGKNKERIFLWALHVNVHIAAENRDKINEVLIFRPDISAIVAYCRPAQTIATDELHTNVLDTEIVLVREFRSPVNNSLAMVIEVPGGSSFKSGVPPEVTAAEEMHEETGLQVAADRFIPVGVRQMASTLSAHKAHVYAVELTPDEMLSLKWEAGKVHGNEADTERTYVEVTTVGAMLGGDLVDWANVGMILATLRA